MSSEVAKTKLCYFGCHTRTLDDKRRLQIPSRWYQKTDDGKVEAIQFALILWPYDGQPDVCIQVLPPPVFDLLWSKVTSVSFGDMEGQALKRTLAEKMVQLDLDSAGRIVLPDWLATGAGLAVGKDAILSGLFDCFQIWSPERYEATRPSVAARVPNAFKTI